LFEISFLARGQRRQWQRQGQHRYESFRHLGPSRLDPSEARAEQDNTRIRARQCAHGHDRDEVHMARAAGSGKNGEVDAVAAREK
jgi:hypothetical protein